jgi:eukaryotic-like serine/threonine-protein kinase
MRNSSPVGLGEIIADKYQIEDVIGEGGMGLVVSAQHLGLRQRVAIKLLLSQGAHIEPAALERFQREARAAARIRSEHVCRVLDVGMLPGGTPYLVMEYLEGCDLADELATRGRLPVMEAVGYVLQACEALAEAHAAGIIHRDLKPANLFLAHRSNGTRCLKLLDFGVSKSLATGEGSELSLTKTSAIVGSPIYMSPEQLHSAKDVDARTDIWALGALLYELITGRPPFYGETIPQLVSAVLNGEPETFASLGLTVPAGLEQAIHKALAKTCDQRYATVGELATALGPYAPDDSISVSRILRIRPVAEREALPETLDDRERDHSRPARKTPRSGPGPLPLATPAPTPPLAERRRSSARWWWALVLFALAGIAAVLSRRLGASETAGADGSGRQVAAHDAGISGPAPLPELPTPATSAAAAATALPPTTAPVAAPPAGGAAEVDAGEVQAPAPRVAPARVQQWRPRTAPRASEETPDGLSNFGGRR